MRTAGLFLSAVLSTVSFGATAAMEDLSMRLTQDLPMMQRQQALEAMEAANANDKAALVPSLKQALRDNNPAVRRNAVQALGALDRFATDTAADLQQMQRDPDEQVRTAAAVSLARLGYGDTAIVNRLAAQLQTQPMVTGEAAVTQAKLARYEAADALGFIAAGPNHIDLSAATGPLSQTVMSDPDTDVKNRAAWALGTMGKQARAAIPALRSASRNPAESDVASWAIDRIQE